jgi:secreted trypsin-like serine protease
MGTVKAGSLLGVIAIAFGLSGGTTYAADNWMREYVQLRKQAMLERAIGIERAAELRARMLAQPKIVGGTKAGPNANPFQVGLLTKSVPDDFQAQFCGGTLVKPNVVVTAAHCSDGSVTPANVQVLTGTRSLDGSGTRRDVKKIFIHPNWNPNTFDSDVAVWILKSNAAGIEKAKLVQLAKEPKTGKTLVTGWGNTTGSGNSFPVDLRQVIVPLQPKADCNDADSYNGAITNNMICAGVDAGGKDSCQGDSGGPLTTRPLGTAGGVGTYDILTGIVSWGIGCADPELFGVYTRVSRFRNWIINRFP